MITFNLLPDSKLERLRAVRRQHKINALSLLAIALGVGLPIVLVILWGGQKAIIGAVQNSIDKKIEKLQNTEGLKEQLTVQNQMRALAGLEQERLHYTTFTSLLPKVLPQDAALSSIQLDDQGALSLQGVTDRVSTINDFVNILVELEMEQNGEGMPLFHDVVLQEVQPTERGIAFEIIATFDSVLLQSKLPGEVKVGAKVVVPFSKAGEDEGDPESLESENTLESAEDAQ